MCLCVSTLCLQQPLSAIPDNGDFIIVKVDCILFLAQYGFVINNSNAAFITCMLHSALFHGMK